MDMEKIYRRYEFDKTEPETLRELVERAIEKGDGARQELRNLGKAARKLATSAVKAGMVIARPSPPFLTEMPPMVGIDGSCQQIGGFGGRWYVPISCAIVKVLEGSVDTMEVEVTANIEEIQQKEFQNVSADASRLMMRVETKAIMTWANRAPKDSYVFLDGPIIDPPSEKESSYVNYRSAAIKACLAKNICVIGCVKKSFDVAFKGYLRKTLRSTDADLSGLPAQFPSDTHLLTFMLSHIAENTPESTYLHTKILPIEENEVTKLYLGAGLRIYFAYLQRDLGTSLLRVEVVVPTELEKDEIDAFVSNALDLCVSNTYPGYYVPLLVQMAHEKCNIRQGCAEVLFDEIMTRARSSESLEQIALSKLR